MPRLRRLVIPGYTQHVIQRGNNRAAVFCDDRDYRTFLGMLVDACTRHDVLVHGFVLMSNHVHLMLTPSTAHGTSRAMQLVCQRYAQAFNHRYGRSGGLWQGRYHAWLIDTDAYWLACLRYVELNPVRAQLVGDASRYRWSSYSAHARGTESIVAPHPLYDNLGRSPTERQTAWRRICLLPSPHITAKGHVIQL